MKKLLAVTLFCSLAFTGCNLKPEEIISEAVTPFKEYKVIEKGVVAVLEEGILETEAKKNKLDLEESSAHVISLKKIGTYASGELRIIGNLTDEGLKERNRKRGRSDSSKIVTYTCQYEYSYKTNYMTWKSDFIY